MEIVSAAQRRFLTKLETAWTTSPTLRFGQLVESVENVGWDLFERGTQQRAYAPRLSQMGDDLFEAAMDCWNASPAARKVVVL